MILIVGATGTIGKHVVTGLLERGQRVRALVRDPKRGQELETLGAQYVLGDLAILPTLEIALEGVKRIFLATQADPRQVELHRNLISEARRKGVEYIVRVSGLGARPDSRVELLRWHAASEEELTRSEVPHLNLRCTAFMQNLLGELPAIDAEGEMVGCVGDARIAYVDARDIAAAAVGALVLEDPPTGTLEVTGPQAVTMKHVADVIGRIRGTPVPYRDLPPHEMRHRYEQAGLPSWLADDLVAIGDELAGGSNATVTDTVKALADREPTSLDQFLEEHAAHIRGGTSSPPG